ncbi:MAG: DNA topoisomerase IB, partial [Actinomycetota bacterium]|nr:DNA topoisomerase IB [Actinomycetota bacterium]
MPRLRRVDCSSPGLTRRRRGKGFEYIDSTGRRVEDPETLMRIRALGIPPAWTNVWICSHPTGHLQAVGTDAAGRRQYLYHEVWRTRRDAEKFDRMIDFALSLPRMRATCDRALEMPGLGRERVLGC